MILHAILLGLGFWLGHRFGDAFMAKGDAIVAKVVEFAKAIYAKFKK